AIADSPPNRDGSMFGDTPARAERAPRAAVDGCAACGPNAAMMLSGGLATGPGAGLSVGVGTFIEKSTNACGFTALPGGSRTSKCRGGPVDRPVFPTGPIGVPRAM